MTREEKVNYIVNKLIELGLVEIIPEPPTSETPAKNTAEVLTK